MNCFCLRPVFPSGWDRFSREKGGAFENFFITNSNPTVTDRLKTWSCVSVFDDARAASGAVRGLGGKGLLIAGRVWVKVILARHSTVQG